MGRIAVAALVLTTAGSALASSPSLQVVRGDVRVACQMTVGGSFEAKTSAVSGSVPGELVVDLAELDSGLALRNQHMKETYLEVGKGDGFGKAVLSDLHIDGGSLDTAQGRIAFTGTLRLHGTARTVNGRAQVRRSAAGVRVEATFPLTLTDYGIARPQYLGIGVKTDVQVRANLDLAP